MRCAVRKYKLQADALGAIGEDNTAARIKLGQWQAQAREFCRQTGIRRDYAREYVGTGGGKQAAAVKVNASGVRALYSSYSGGSVTTAYTKERKEEAENLAALMPLARQGKAVTLIAPSKKTGVRSADAIIDGEKWEVKTNYTPTVSAIDSALRSGNGQAKNLVVHVKSNISDDAIMQGIKQRLHRTDIECLVIVKNGKTKIMYRKDILK